MPPFLVQGDKVAILATARAVLAHEAEKGADLLRKNGLLPLSDPHTIGTQWGAFSAPDQVRLHALNDYLLRPDIKALWLARGGYGNLRLLSGLHWDRVLQYPKWIAGFSDATFLLNALVDKGVCTIHGPMPISLAQGPLDMDSPQLVVDMLLGQKPTYHWRGEGQGEGAIRGKLVGGNLACLSHLYPGLSPHYFDQAILLLEEVDEYLYQVDRMVRGMVYSGRLDGLAAVLVGDFTKIKDNELPFGESLGEILAKAFEPLGIPVVTGFSAGHAYPNWPVVLGAEYTLGFSQESGQYYLSMS
jgi:muramoyltetrapeptide carboxypeptidase